MAEPENLELMAEAGVLEPVHDFESRERVAELGIRELMAGVGPESRS